MQNINYLQVIEMKKYYVPGTNMIKAIDNISFNMKKGEIVGVMGASGSGKTTLLNCLACIDRMDGGQIFLRDCEITKLKPNEVAEFRKKNLGFIFQEFNLLDTLTVRENISLVLTINKIKKKDIFAKVDKIAKVLNISDVLEK